MQKKAKKRKPKYFRIFMSLALLGCGIYFLGVWVYGLFTDNAATYVANVGTLRVEEKTNAVVIRNEMLVKTELKGKLTYFYNEGDRVRKGDAVAEVFNDGNAITTSEESEREQLKKQMEFDYNSLESDIEKNIKAIELALDNKQYEVIPDLKHQLVLKIERMNKLKTENRFLTNRTETYTEQTVGKGVLTEGQKKVLMAPANGILSYASDGLEQVLTINTIYNVKIANFLSEPSKNETLKSDYVSGNHGLLRLVDEATYYLAATIPLEKIETYKAGMSVVADFGTLKTEAEILDAYAEDINGVVILRLKEGFENYHVKRTVPLSIVKDDYKGIKVPTDAILNQDGTLSVYVVESNKKLKKVPVKIIGYDAEFAVVYNEQFYDAKMGVVRSLKIGQSIVRNAHMYKEGQILD